MTGQHPTEDDATVPEPTPGETATYELPAMDLETPEAGVPDPTITDPKAMRALAHPVRLELLEALRTEGTLTATRAAEMLDESPGNMSWHLQTLAKYGFVEEAEGGKGRSRPWKLKSARQRFSSVEGDPTSQAAGQALVTTIFNRSAELLTEWWTVQQSFDQAWREAAFLTDTINYLTVDELAELSLQVIELTSRFAERTDEDSPEGAIPVHISAHAHPLPPKAGGS